MSEKELSSSDLINIFKIARVGLDMKWNEIGVELDLSDGEIRRLCEIIAITLANYEDIQSDRDWQAESEMLGTC